MNGSPLVFGEFSLLFALFYEEIKDFPFSYVSICFLSFVKQFLALFEGIL